MVALLVLGLLTLIVGTNNFVQFTLTCASWSAALFIMSAVSEDRGVKEIQNFDKHAQEVAKDIEINGTASEYYEVFDETTYNVNRFKRIKQLRRQNRISKFFAIILLITSIICLF